MISDDEETDDTLYSGKSYDGNVEDSDEESLDDHITKESIFKVGDESTEEELSSDGESIFKVGNDSDETVDDIKSEDLNESAEESGDNNTSSDDMRDYFAKFVAIMNRQKNDDDDSEESSELGETEDYLKEQVVKQDTVSSAEENENTNENYGNTESVSDEEPVENDGAESEVQDESNYESDGSAAEETGESEEEQGDEESMRELKPETNIDDLISYDFDDGFAPESDSIAELDDEGSLDFANPFDSINAYKKDEEEKKISESESSDKSFDDLRIGLEIDNVDKSTSYYEPEEQEEDIRDVIEDEDSILEKIKAAALYNTASIELEYGDDEKDEDESEEVNSLDEDQESAASEDYSSEASHESEEGTSEEYSTETSYSSDASYTSEDGTTEEYASETSYSSDASYTSEDGTTEEYASETSYSSDASYTSEDSTTEEYASETSYSSDVSYASEDSTTEEYTSETSYSSEEYAQEEKSYTSEPVTEYDSHKSDVTENADHVDDNKFESSVGKVDRLFEASADSDEVKDDYDSSAGLNGLYSGGSNGFFSDRNGKSFDADSSDSYSYQGDGTSIGISGFDGILKASPKGGDYPEFSSSLFPGLGRGTVEIKNDFDEVAKKESEKLDEQLKKEEEMQKQAEELLASLGIKL